MTSPVEKNARARRMAKVASLHRSAQRGATAVAGRRRSDDARWAAALGWLAHARDLERAGQADEALPVVEVLVETAEQEAQTSGREPVPAYLRLSRAPTTVAPAVARTPTKVSHIAQFDLEASSVGREGCIASALARDSCFCQISLLYPTAIMANPTKHTVSVK